MSTRAERDQTWKARHPERAREIRAISRERVGRDVLAARQRDYHAANREEILERRRERAASPEAKARKAETDRLWYAANRARRLEVGRRYRLSEEGRAIRLAAGERRRARIWEAEIDFDRARDWSAILAEYGDRCVYCGASEDLSLDHDVPISRGGSHGRRNVVPACRLCNSRKGTATGAEYVLRRLQS